MSRFHKDTDGFRSFTRYKSSPPTPPSQAPECPVALCCFHRPVFKVTRVIDGEELRIRLYGVDSPEKGEPCIEEATSRLGELAGGEVWVELGARSRDRYGRLLYYVFPGAGESVAEKLIREGLGEAWTRDGQHRDLLMGLDRKAHRAKKGCLW